MYPVVNPYPHFVPFDICKVKATGGYVIIKEVNCNRSQVEDKHQWSYSVMLIDTEVDNKVAWYNGNDLTKVNNLMEILSKEVRHPFGSSDYRFSLQGLRRSKL